jgi:hypothetical protein
MDPGDNCVIAGITENLVVRGTHLVGIGGGRKRKEPVGRVEFSPPTGEESAFIS